MADDSVLLIPYPNATTWRTFTGRNTNFTTLQLCRSSFIQELALMFHQCLC
jgi:hypothetical protein